MSEHSRQHATDLNDRTLANIRYSALARAIAMAFQAVASIILARYLSAHDYGVVGFAFIFINFLTQFQDFGLNTAAVQTAELDEDSLATAFWMKTALGLLMCGAAIVAAPLARWFIDDAGVSSVLRVLSLNFVVGALAFIPTTLLTRALDYRTLSLAQILSSIVNGSVAIGLALAGFGYWSIVLGNLVAAAVSVIALNLARPHRIALRFVRASASRLLVYGSGMFGSGLVIFALFNADNFLIGTTLGADALGYYTIAFNWGALVAVTMGAVVNSVLFPTFARIQSDRARLRRAYLTALHYIAAVGILANVTLFFVAPELLVHVLGRGTDKWLPALAAFRVLCIYGISRVVLEPLGTVMMAIGRPGAMFRSNLIVAALEVALLYPALLSGGIVGAAVVVTFAYTVQYALYYPFYRRELAIDWRDFTTAVTPGLAAAAVIAPLLFVPQEVLGGGTPRGLVMKGAAATVAYIAAFGMITRWKVLDDLHWRSPA